MRDLSKPDKCDHLLAMNDLGLPGSVELVEADLFDMGSYDKALEGCTCLIHAGAAVGYNQESPQEVYDGCYTSTKDVLNSCIKAKTIKRVVFTSSFAAVGHSAPEGYVFTEQDWCGDGTEGYWGDGGIEGGSADSKFADAIGENRDLAYAMAKAESEVYAYRVAAEHGFDAMSILPCHVIGPLLAPDHNKGFSWQWCIGKMMEGGEYFKSKDGRMLWNCVDVRDTARAHRLCMQSETIPNGSRYW